MKVSSNIIKQLDKINLSKLKLKNGNTVQKELERHAKILADCIMEELDKVYDAYEPSVYKRTYGLYNSLYIGNTKVNVSANGSTMSINIGFDDGAIHKSFTGEDVNTAVLLNEGWMWKNPTVDIPYLSRRSGIHFIEKGIEQYRRKVDKPFTVKFSIT